jgi:hypothetical protein
MAVYVEPYWTEERILRAFKIWARRRGRAPTAKEWATPTARQPEGRGRPRWRAPHPHTVAAVFGSWSAGLEAAGLETRPAHRPQAPQAASCGLGHDLTDPANVYVRASGQRECRICRRAYDRAWKRRRRAAQAA